MRAATATAGRAPAVRRPRPLQSYLLLPRPKDAVKWWLLPLAFGVGALADGVSGRQAAVALAVWAVLELLIYQARYQWNDIRGFAADQRHPDAASRGRLPGPLERGPAHIAASRLVIGLRLALAVATGLALGRLELILGLVAAVIGVAAVYEAVRSRATGGSEAAPTRAAPAIVALWLVVGGGYAIRGVTGLGLAVDLGERPGLASAAVIGMWAYGIVFVTMRWAIESLAFARVGDGEELVWETEPDQAREHTLALARWVPRRPGKEGRDPTRWQALRRSTPLSAPWNLGFLTASAAAAVAGTLLAGPTGHGTVALAAALGAASAFPVMRLAARGAVAIGSAAVLAAGLAVAGAPRPVLAALPWLLMAGAYARFTAQSLATMGRPFWRSVR